VKISSHPLQKTSLTNGGALDFILLGCGSAFASTLNQTNILLVKGDDHLLIDCGTRCASALQQIGLALSSIRTFLITHSHADHIGGLEEAQLGARYITKKRPNMVITPHYQDILWNQSLRGGAEHSEVPRLSFSDFWNVIRPTPLDGFSRECWQTSIGSIDIKMFRTKHFPDKAKSWRDSAWSCGVLIDERVLFTSDTRFDPALLEEFNRRFDLEVIFHDCQLFTGGVHAGIEELTNLPESIRRKMVLVHYGDNWRDFVTLAANANFHSWGQQGHSYQFN
jgi:ribonuclease BN (tRNA processing enzyme)